MSSQTQFETRFNIKPEVEMICLAEKTSFIQEKETGEYPYVPSAELNKFTLSEKKDFSFLCAR
jgi:hypothetical protein